jgi:hypothetical protein
MSELILLFEPLQSWSSHPVHSALEMSMETLMNALLGGQGQALMHDVRHQPGTARVSELSPQDNVLSTAQCFQVTPSY